MREYHPLITRLGGRKFIFAIFSTVALFAFLGLGYLTEAGFSNLFKWLGVAYLGANSASKAASKIGRDDA